MASTSCNNLSWDDIRVGAEYSFQQRITSVMVQRFASLSGDHNPLHVDAKFAATTSFQKPIVHGMLLASFFSRLIGERCPGLHSLYFSQTLAFRGPIFVGETVTVQARVIAKSDSTRMITLETVIIGPRGIAVRGEAKASYAQEQKTNS